VTVRTDVLILAREVTGMTSELDDLEHALVLVGKVNLAGAPGATKAEALRRLNQYRNMFDAIEAHTITAFEATKEHRAEGHASPIEYLKHHCRVRGPEVARRRKLARRLRSMPLLDQAMTDGQVTIEHVDVLARAQRLVGERSFAFLEEGLVDMAVTDRFGDFVRNVEYWVMRALPADAEDRLEQQIEERGASSSRLLDGAGRVDADFDPLSFPTKTTAQTGSLPPTRLMRDRRTVDVCLGCRSTYPTTSTAP
jgi:hypothetical protein